jgi:hypothetical protein
MSNSSLVVQLGSLRITVNTDNYHNVENIQNNPSGAIALATLVATGSIGGSLILYGMVTSLAQVLDVNTLQSLALTSVFCGITASILTTAEERQAITNIDFKIWYDCFRFVADLSINACLGSEAQPVISASSSAVELPQSEEFGPDVDLVGVD